VNVEPTAAHGPHRALVSIALAAYGAALIALTMIRSLSTSPGEVHPTTCAG
jgi:hypothetical protein